VPVPCPKRRRRRRWCQQICRQIRKQICAANAGTTVRGHRPSQQQTASLADFYGLFASAAGCRRPFPVPPSTNWMPPLAPPPLFLEANHKRFIWKKTFFHSFIHLWSHLLPSFLHLGQALNVSQNPGQIQGKSRTKPWPMAGERILHILHTFPVQEYCAFANPKLIKNPSNLGVPLAYFLATVLANLSHPLIRLKAA
jgi:hypothetical protein